MYGPFPENPEEAIRVLLDSEEPDTPLASFVS